ncbi:hypothetical protein ABIA30_005008, partial [Mycobacterium sp. MAA66]
MTYGESRCGTVCFVIVVAFYRVEGGVVVLVGAGLADVQ